MKVAFRVLFIFFLSFAVRAQTTVFDNIDELLLKGNYQEALVLLEKQPKTMLVFDKTAGIYQTMGNYTKAIEFYKKALQIDSLTTIKVKLGNAYNLSGLKSKALLTYEDIIKKDSSNLLVLNSLGKIYLSEFQAKRSEKIYRYLKRKDSLNPFYPFQLAEALSKQSKFLKMGQSYLDAYKLDTLHLRSIYELSKFFKKIRDKDSTNLFIDKGLVIDIKSVNFNLLKVQELYFDKQFESAIEVLNRLDSLHYKSVTTYEMMGMCYYNLKQYDLAEKEFRKGLSLDYENSSLFYRLASLNYDKKDLKQAEMYALMSVFKATPKLDKQYFLLGIISNDKHDYKKAVKYFDKAFINNNNNYKALFQFALASDTYYKDKKKGLILYQKYIDRFESKNKENTLFAKARIKDIRKQLFLKGESLNKE
ncbi:MAG: tetratricopeptide repeat protein [Flavobacteriales bacterium]|nr:tetratricopeptide repeat protein [Flavobacteriales bacterium]